MPIWVKETVDRWMLAAKVNTGRIFRAISRHGTPWGKGISENVIWYVVRRCAERMQLDHLAPHDLRSTKLCHINGGEIEQIQFLLDTHPYSPQSVISISAANKILRSL